MSLPLGALDKLSPSQLLELKERAEKRWAEIEQEVEQTYHSNIVNLLGLRALAKIPVVAHEALDLRQQDYHSSIPLSKLGPHSAVRGKDPVGRPFVAMKVKLLDAETLEPVATVVEIVFQRYLDQSTNWVSGSCIGDDEKAYQSGLYRQGSMTKAQLERVGQLLGGETIPHAFNNAYKMVLA